MTTYLIIYTDGTSETTKAKDDYSIKTDRSKTIYSIQETISK